jgi:1,4-dihydroxy-2-naphthoyl-CoA hydrolase
MFIAHNQVRMNDTDAAGILYFANQFRFAHDALEDFFESEGYSFSRMLYDESFIFVIVHAEADFLAPLAVSDKLEIHVNIEKIGTSSFTISFHIYKSPDSTLVGTAKTVHVYLDRTTRKKKHIPEHLSKLLHKYLTKEKP